MPSSTRTAAAPGTGGGGRGRASACTGGPAILCKYMRKVELWSFRFGLFGLVFKFMVTRFYWVIVQSL